METLNMTDNLLLRWWKPFRVGPRRRGAAFLLSPNTTAHQRREAAYGDAAGSALPSLSKNS